MFNYFKIIVLLCIISSLARFSLDSYLPSLPEIGDYFLISDSTTQLTLTLYLLGFSFSQLIYGPLSDRYGRRIVMLVGLSIFALGSFGCAIAGSPELLIAARLITGIGAGACGVLNRAIASDCFKGAEFSKAWSYTTTTLVITLSVAPVIGGYIQQIWDWRTNFILTTLVVGVVFGIIFKYLPETHLNIQKNNLNIKKILQDYYSIFMVPSFFAGTLCYTLAFAGLVSYFQVSPLLFMNQLKLSPAQYGWCSFIIAANYLLGGIVVNQFADRLGMKKLLIIGALLLISGGLLMCLENFYQHATVAAVMFPAAVYVIGARIVIPNAIASAMQEVRHLNGSSSALIGFIQMFGASLISFAIASFDNSSSLPLAIFMTILGVMTLVFSVFKNIPKLKTKLADVKKN